MARLDLDDLPPKIAALLSGLSNGDELILVQNGVVVGRLTASNEAGVATEPPPSPEQSLREVAEDFRAAIEDGF
ncbi:hypothetical protein [Phenylobacterium sp.]|jgi:sulfur transfer complex TusBCD TusB component (DsrH family)|uniref:hypothetical protein n=1 Tax=Phenylobacterium sp. TaxID=1871053 RepID=UPI0037C9B220